MSAAATRTRRIASEELGASFKAVLAAVRRLRGRESRRHDELSNAQYGLLFGLRDDQELSSGELADLAGISPATVAEMLDSLGAAGLVNRTRSQRDRRVVLTSLTEHGQELLEARHARFEPRWLAALSSFSDQELRTTAAVLDSLRKMLDETPRLDRPAD